MKRRKVDLEFWLDMYDWLDVESERIYQEIDWIDQNFFYPPEKYKKELDEAYKEMRHIDELKLYVRKRLLKYNR